MCVYVYVYVGKMGTLWANTGLYGTKYSFIDPDYHINIEDYFPNVDIIGKVSSDVSMCFIEDCGDKTSFHLTVTLK